MEGILIVAKGALQELLRMNGLYEGHSGLDGKRFYKKCSVGSTLDIACGGDVTGSVTQDGKADLVGGGECDGCSARLEGVAAKEFLSLAACVATKMQYVEDLERLWERKLSVCKEEVQEMLEGLQFVLNNTPLQKELHGEWASIIGRHFYKKGQKYLMRCFGCKALLSRGQQCSECGETPDWVLLKYWKVFSTRKSEKLPLSVAFDMWCQAVAIMRPKKSIFINRADH